MAPLFTSPHIADAILAVLALEAIGLALHRRRTGRGPTLRAVLPFLAAGACLVLALRGALSGARWEWIAVALTGALVAHVADLSRRWPGGD